MSYRLKIKAFFFNAKTDYLPYYKHFTVTIDKNANIVDVLEAIHAQNENFSYPKENLVFKINQLVIDHSITLQRIVERCGLELQIDPVTSYRSNNGLIINDDDFMQSFSLLAPYTTDADKSYYKTLYALHYASETSNYVREYIGDAILVLAHKLIIEGHPQKEDILLAISNVTSGLNDCEYENNLFETNTYKEQIDVLKQMSKRKYKTFSLHSLLAHFSTKKQIVLAKDIENLDEKRVAFYGKKVKCNQEIIAFSKENKLSGQSLLISNPTLAFTKAGTILLDAYDAGAEVLIVEDTSILEMFQNNFHTIENTIGRKILDMHLISLDDFVSCTHIQHT